MTCSACLLPRLLPLRRADSRDQFDRRFLGRRGCWNTSFHFAKLLLSIDPYSDVSLPPAATPVHHCPTDYPPDTCLQPQAALLHLDFLALKSGHSQWVLDLTSTFDAAIADMGPGGGRVGVLPGWKWTRALAVRNLEGVRTLPRRDENLTAASKLTALTCASCRTARRRTRR